MRQLKDRSAFRLLPSSRQPASMRCSHVFRARRYHHTGFTSENLVGAAGFEPVTLAVSKKGLKQAKAAAGADRPAR